MPVELFEFHVLRWKLPLMHARELGDIVCEKVADERADYDDFIVACKAVYSGASRIAELTRYLVVLVMFSRTALEPAVGRKAKMDAVFQWATGEAPTTKGKAGRLGAALRVSHFLFCHAKYMDAFARDRYFSLNNVIDCPRALLKDDRRLTRLLDQLSKSRHSTTRVAEAARRIVHEQEGEERDDASVSRAASSHAISNRAGPPPRLRSITALKEDGTYLVQQSNRSRCVSLTKEAIASIEGGAALLAAFAATHRAELVVEKKATTKHRAVLGICGRRGKQHQAQLEGNTTWRWFSTAQLLLWENGRAKVEEYDALHPESTVNQEEQLAISEAKELTYFIDMMSRGRAR